VATDRRARGFVGNLIFSIVTVVLLNIRRELVGISKALLLTAFATVTALAGCSQMDVVAERETAPISEGGIEDEGIEDGGKDGGTECDEPGPRILVGDSIADDCEAGDSKRAFRYALCVCSDYTDTADAWLKTDSFDSSRNDSDSSSTGGSVGVNGYIQNNGVSLDINGSLRVAGDSEGRSITVSNNAEIQIGQELEVKSAIQADLAAVTVDGDARIGGDVRLDTFNVNGSLTMPSDANLSVSESPPVNPDNQEPIHVEPPCACEDIEDIPALVAQVSEVNDNELLDFDIKELENFTGQIPLQLPCGRFYLRGLTGTGKLELSITGRAALYITGQVKFNDGPVWVKLDRDAELDIYIADTMVAASDLTFGAVDNPARVRLFVGGSGTLILGGKNLISGQVYAPRSELNVTTGETEIYGSVFVRRAQLSAPLTIHYDRNPIETGLDCSE